MTNDKRACIAFICGMKVNPYRNKQMVFDYSRVNIFISWLCIVLFLEFMYLIIRETDM